jgi:hypothetical protein
MIMMPYGRCWSSLQFTGHADFWHPAGHGRIVAEFFDTGYSRTLAQPRRPQAAALVAALADPDCGWDAIVIGEYERAFCGGRYASMAPLFEHHGIQLRRQRSAGPCPAPVAGLLLKGRLAGSCRVCPGLIGIGADQKQIGLGEVIS